MRITSTPLALFGGAGSPYLHSRSAGVVGALTLWGPMLLLAAGEAAPQEVWVTAYGSPLAREHAVYGTES